jgi:nitrate/TMAO reductase-like tetraheme cytochrome c subunit
MKHNKPRPSLIATLVIASLLLIPTLDGCGLMRGLPSPLVIFVSGDSRGYLEPCGCRRDQAGGLPGRATIIEASKAAARLVLDVGNLTPGSRPYELLKLRYLLQGMEQIGYDAVNLGRREAELDRDTLKRTLDGSQLPFVSANVVEKNGRRRLTEPFRIIQRGSLKVGVTGVTTADPYDVGPGLEVRPPMEALAEVVPDLERRCDYLIVLAFVDEDAIREIAGKFHEVDCILGGDVPQPSSSAQEINRAIVFNVMDKGKVIGEIQLKRQDSGYRVERSRGIKIVGDRLTPHPAMVKLIDRYKAELRERRYELASAEGMERIPGQESTADEFVGDKKCVSCHPSEHQVTVASKHHHAFQTLIDKKSEFDPECLSCHTVGYGLHSGFIDAEKTPHLANVQCENCHGRGKEHVNAMLTAARKPSTLKPVTQATCIRCHDQENSENFKFATFWPPIAH